MLFFKKYGLVAFQKYTSLFYISLCHQIEHKSNFYCRFNRQISDDSAESARDSFSRHGYILITSDGTTKDVHAHHDAIYSADVQSDSLQMFLTVKSYDFTFEIRAYTKVLRVVVGQSYLMFL
jgi:hypothetical protein